MALLDAEVRTSGARGARTTLALAMCFHHAVLDDGGPDAAIRDLDQLTRGHDYAYYTDIAHFMAGRSLHIPSTERWYDGPDQVRDRWRSLVTARPAQPGPWQGLAR
ncbi:hypothetical protein ACFVVA_38235 [Kitasatospora sp. NPDC058048]|uniref:hypothetical protein n=1 Tax=Kitasatospora sp. NPDC058048 TaxID=3346313 RepID=UPI0036D888C1